MAYLNNNSTNLLIDAGKSYIGTGVQLTDAEFTSVQCSFNVAGGGTGSWKLMFMHSFDGITYESYGDEYEYTINGSYSRSVLLKAKYFHIRFENNKTQNLTNFHLYCKLSLNLNDDLNVNIDSRYDSITVVGGATGLNTRLLTIDDEITIPSLDACITGNSINVNITGGSLVIGSDTNIFASNGDILTATSGGLDVHVDNFSDIPKLSSITDSVSIPALTSVKDSVTAVISGTVPVSGSVSITNQITGFSTSANQVLTNTKLDTINTTITNKYLNSSTDSVTVNTISGFSLDTTTQVTNENLENIVNKTGDIQGNIYYTDGATVWLDSVPIPTVNPLDPNGWLYTNTNSGNAMNLFYFNGVNEIKTLSQVTGQYAVVTNLSTKLNDKMIFTIYTKSATSFFTSRITHIRQNSSFSMVAGGKYLLYWGNVPADIYPSLPRINCPQVGTTGPANPNEEVLSVTLNTDSGALAGDIDISIESLGVVFDNQSRVYTLLGSPTEYETLVNIKTNTDNLDNLTFTGNDLNVKISNPSAGITGYALETTLNDIKYKTDLLEFYNESGINELMIYDRATESIKNNTDGLTNLTFTDSNLNVNISNPTAGITGYSLQSTQLEVLHGITGINQTIIDKHLNSSTDSITVNTISGFNLQSTQLNVLSGITGLNQTIIDKTLSKLTSSIDISGQSVNVNTISGFALETGGNLASIKANSDKFIFNGNNLLTTISNTGFDAKIRDKDNNAISSTAYGIDGVRGLDVSIKNATQADPLVVEIPTTNVINTFSTNLPASYPIDAGGALSSVNASLFVNLRDVSGNAYGVSGNPLYVQSNLITGFALETGGNLASIKTNTDKFKFTGDNLKTTITNASLTVETGTNPLIIASGANSLDVNITGGTITGADGKAYLYSGDTVTPITQTTISTKSGIDSNIINTSIDTHCYGSSNGTLFHHLKTTNQGNLITESKTHDGSNVPITSTLNGAKQSLDVNVSNTVPVTGTFYQATQPVSGSVSATVGNLNSVTNTIQAGIVGKTFLDCMSDIKAINSLGGGNNTLITCSLVESQKTGNTVNQYTAALDTNSFISAYNPTSGNIKILSMTESGNTRALDVNDATGNTTLSAISSKMVTQTNSVSGGATVGLNVYNIYPNRLIYRMAGSASAPVASQFLGPEALAFDGNTFNIGLNYATNFNIYLTTAGTRSVDLDYIDANGNRALTTISINNTDQVRLSSAVNINSMNWTPVLGNVDTRLRAIARTGVYRNQLSTFLSGAGVITVPNGYVGIVSNLYYYTANGDDLIMVIKDKYNNQKTTRYMANITPINAKYNNIGDLNEPLIAGDSVYFLSALSGSGQKYVHAIVRMEPL